MQRENDDTSLFAVRVLLVGPSYSKGGYLDAGRGAVHVGKKSEQIEIDSSLYYTLIATLRPLVFLHCKFN